LTTDDFRLGLNLVPQTLDLLLQLGNNLVALLNLPATVQKLFLQSLAIVHVHFQLLLQGGPRLIRCLLQSDCLGDHLCLVLKLLIEGLDLCDVTRYITLKGDA